MDNKARCKARWRLEGLARPHKDDDRRRGLSGGITVALRESSASMEGKRKQGGHTGIFLPQGNSSQCMEGTWELLEMWSLPARLEMTLRELVSWRGGDRKKNQLRGCRWEGQGGARQLASVCLPSGQERD